MRSFGLMVATVLLFLPLAQAQPLHQIDQHLTDPLEFVRELPGHLVLRERRVEDQHVLILKSENVMPIFNGLAQRGWKVHMTEERLEARRGELVIYGKLTASRMELQVSPVSNSLDQDQPFDFSPVFQRLEAGETVQLEVGPYRLTALLSAFGTRGWRMYMTKDRMDGRLGERRFEGILEGSRATLKMTKMEARP